MWKPTGAGDAVYSFAATLHSVLGRPHAAGGCVGVVKTPEPVGRLSRSACRVPELFGVARGQMDVCPNRHSDGLEEHEDPALVLTAELRARGAALLPVAEALDTCAAALGECVTFLAPAGRWRLQNALRTLETEFLRLRDAQQYLFDRRIRGVRTGEPDLDPEFTIVLERVVYASQQSDEVANSVAQAVRTIAAELLPYVASERL